MFRSFDLFNLPSVCFWELQDIANPLTINFKVLMRELFLLEEPLSWDDCVPENMRVAWINLMMETLESGDFLFHIYKAL